MTPAQIAAADQAAARENRFEKAVARWALNFVGLALLVAGYSALAIEGIVPGNPDAPAFQTGQVEDTRDPRLAP